MHILALIVALAVAGFLFGVGHPIIAVVVGLFVASGIWFAVPAILRQLSLTPAGLRDRNELRLAIRKHGLPDWWSRRMRRNLFDLWQLRRFQLAREGQALSADEYVRHLNLEHHETR